MLAISPAYFEASDALRALLLPLFLMISAAAFRPPELPLLKRLPVAALTFIVTGLVALPSWMVKEAYERAAIAQGFSAPELNGLAAGLIVALPLMLLVVVWRQVQEQGNRKV